MQNEKKQISEAALEEWNRVVIRPLIAIYKWTLVISLFLTIFYQGNEMTHLEYFTRYTLVPAVVLFLVIAVMWEFFHRQAKKMERIAVAVVVILLMNLYVAISLIAYNNFQVTVIVVFLPIIIAPVYKEKKLVYLQVGISLLMLILCEGYTLWSGNTVPDEQRVMEIAIMLFLFYAMVKLELEVVASANMMDIQSSRDSLTRLFNHEKFYEVLEDRMENFIVNKESFSVIISDIDDFKKVNDTYGHAFGNEVLKQVSQIIMNCRGTKDICTRYGGEEFALILPNKSLHEAVLQAERIRKEFAATEFMTEDGTTHHFSISLGVAEYDREYKTGSAFFEVADKALYEAKRSGKNKVCCSR